MDGRIQCQYGDHSRYGRHEIGPISQQGDAAVMEDVQESDLSATMTQNHENSVHQFIELGAPVHHHPMQDQTLIFLLGEQIPHLCIIHCKQKGNTVLAQLDS